MKLRFKPLQLEAGRLVGFINKHVAELLNVIEGDRIELEYKKTKITLPVNIVEKFLEKDEISLSEEAETYLKVKKGNLIEASIALEPESTRFILKKLHNKELNKNEIFSIVKDIVNNSLNEAEIAYFVSGVYNNDMTLQETIHLTEAIARTGKTLKWKSNMVADKHSIAVTEAVPVIAVVVWTLLAVPADVIE